MKRIFRKAAAWLLAAALALTLAPGRGRAALSGVYFTAVNGVLMDLTAETMPFLSNGVLYVPHTVFQGTDLGVNYARNYSMHLAILYTMDMDLRFNLEEQTVEDKEGQSYEGHAIEKGDYIFFPLDMVCRYFGLSWTYRSTDTVPLIRVTSGVQILSDEKFIDAAAGRMAGLYSAYESQVQQQGGAEEGGPYLPIAGQQVHLVIAGQSGEEARQALSLLAAADAQATFLLTADQLELDGDLLRGVVAGGHSAALLILGQTPEEVEAELERARDLAWREAMLWLDLAWYEGSADIAPLLGEMGFSLMIWELDRRETGLSSSSQARSLLASIAAYRRDLGVYLGPAGGCTDGLTALLTGLDSAGCHICSWHMVSG